MLLHQNLQSERTRVVPVTHEIAQAMLSRSSLELRSLNGLIFPQPFRTPPMIDDFLPAVVQRLQYEPGQAGWWGWIFTEQKSRKVLGSVGLSGPPDSSGSVGMAYSIYPEYENQSYTKEAVKAVTDWIMGQPGVKSVRLTIKPKNYAAVRVSQFVKFELKGAVTDPVVGEVNLYEAKKRIIAPPPSSLIV